MGNSINIIKQSSNNRSKQATRTYELTQQKSEHTTTSKLLKYKQDQKLISNNTRYYTAKNIYSRIALQ